MQRMRRARVNHQSHDAVGMMHAVLCPVHSTATAPSSAPEAEGKWTLLVFELR